MKGFVYFFKHINVDAVKIGFTTSDDLTQRFRSFSTSSPYGAKILGFIDSDNPRKLESIIHAELEPHRINGEFFEISEERVNHLVSTYSKSNGLGLESLLKIERYVSSVSDIEKQRILAKISRYFDSIINNDKRQHILTPEESNFLKKYKPDNGNLVKKTCTEIQEEYFQNDSVRKVGLFLKNNGFVQKVERCVVNNETISNRLYYLYL